MGTIRSSSHWGSAEIHSFLNDTIIPIRLACLDSQAKPLVCSLWYLYDGEALWCATQASASVVGLLTNTPECGFEVAPESMPYRGVRGQGTVELLPDKGLHVLEQLIDRYLGSRNSDFAQWLIVRANDEVAIRIQPDWYTAWDFSKRMQN